LIIVGKEVDVAVAMMLLNAAERSRRGGPESTRHKVFGFEPKNVEPKLT
jgi:hypothetical protein